MTGLSDFEILDPDWDDEKPVTVAAQNPLAAIRKFYSLWLLEKPPAMQVHPRRGVGSGSECSIGDTRIEQFIITSQTGKEFSVYFD